MPPDEVVMILLALNEYAGIAKEPHMEPLVRRAQRLGGVLDHRYAELGADGQYAVVVRGQAVEVHNDHRFGYFSFFL